MNGDLKQTFILQAVQQYVSDCKKAMEIMIVRKGAVDTEALIKSLSARARENGNGATGELLFLEYGRMVDMGAGRGHPLGGLRSTSINIERRKISGRNQVKDHVRKPRKIYSTVVYGRLTYLQNKLLYGYTEAAIASLKQMANGSSN